MYLCIYEWGTKQKTNDTMLNYVVVIYCNKLHFMLVMNILSTNMYWKQARDEAFQNSDQTGNEIFYY